MAGCVEEYLTAEKVGAILDVTPQMVRKLCHGGHLPFYKVGRCIRISRADFEKYLTRQRVVGPPGIDTGDWPKSSDLQGSIKTCAK